MKTLQKIQRIKIWICLSIISPSSWIKEETKGNFKRIAQKIYTCFECEKQDHIKVGCPTFLKKQQGGEKMSFKKKRAYIALDNNDESSSRDSIEEEEANLCLMAEFDKDETKINVSDSSSKSNTNYDNLLEAFKELNEEAQRLNFVNKNSKRLS